MASKKLDCMVCPSFCCRMAGDVEVYKPDIRRLADHLGLTVQEFRKKHVLKPQRGSKFVRIKAEEDACPFLAADHRCSVYEARPKNCRGYVCWDQNDMTVYGFASMAQLPIKTLHRQDRAKAK